MYSEIDEIIKCLSCYHVNSFLFRGNKSVKKEDKVSNANMRIHSPYTERNIHKTLGKPALSMT